MRRIHFMRENKDCELSRIISCHSFSDAEKIFAVTLEMFPAFSCMHIVVDVIVIVVVHHFEQQPDLLAISSQSFAG